MISYSKGREFIQEFIFLKMSHSKHGQGGFIFLFKVGVFINGISHPKIPANQILSMLLNNGC
jgi:hypothetical protein